MALPRALILVGGMGTRLRSVVSDVPKPMAPIAGRPFLEWQLEYLRGQGLRQFTLLTGYKSDVVEKQLGDGSRWGIEITYSREDEPLGTGGAVALAMSRVSGDEFLVLNGDSLFLTDLREFIRSSQGKPSVCLHYQSDLERFGSVKLQKPDQRISEFVEKGVASSVGGYINAGVYLLRRDDLKSFGSGKFSLETNVFPRLIAEETLFGHIGAGPFIDIGIPESFAQAQQFIPEWVGQPPKPCLFLDRDGILVEHVNYLHKPEEVRLIPEIAECIRRVRAKGWHVIVCSNQSGVGRGLFSAADCDATNARIAELLSQQDAYVDEWHMCYFHPDHGQGGYKKESMERKPNPGMPLKASSTRRIDLSASLFIGDNRTDKLDFIRLETWLLQGDFDLTGAEASARVFRDRKDLLAALIDRLGGHS